MYPISVFVCGLLCFACVGVRGGDLEARGLDLGGGFTAHLDTVPSSENATIFQRHALRVDYRGIGVRFGMDEDHEAFKVGLYYDEGRGKKNKVSEMLVPAILGYKTTTLIVLSISAIAALVLKSLALAKMALVISTAIFIQKLFSKHGHPSHHSAIELEHHPSELHPVYAEYPGDISELGYTQTSSGNYVPYHSSLQDTNDIHTAGSATQFTFADASIANLTSNSSLQKRGDNTKPHPIHTLITIRRKTVSNKII